MLKHYYFNDKVDDNYRHEVHTKECLYLPAVENRTYIGYESSCKEAINLANAKHPSKDFDGCFWCSRACHKG